MLSHEHATFAEELTTLYNIGRFPIIGSVGRAAMYETLAWPQVPPFALQSMQGDPRDIDIMATYDLPYGIDTSSFTHAVDARIFPYLIAGEEVAFVQAWTGKAHIKLPLDPEVIALRTRSLCGGRLRTFAVGTQVHLEQINPHIQTAAKYQPARILFNEFVQYARIHSPDEFLPDSFYEPFYELDAQRQHYAKLTA